MIEPPVSQPWGLREFAIREPDGHVLRFLRLPAGLDSPELHKIYNWTDADHVDPACRSSDV